MQARPVRTTVMRWAMAALAVAHLAACAVPEWQKPGAPAAEVQADLGVPHLRVPLPDGGQRWVYSRQPAGQQVFHMVFDAQQRLQRVDQVLQEAHFLRLKKGLDTRQSVLEYFGKPALVEGVGNFQGDVWTYRLHENSIDRLAHVFIDPQHVVQHVMFTDEQRLDDDPRR